MPEPLRVQVVPNMGEAFSGNAEAGGARHVGADCTAQEEPSLSSGTGCYFSQSVVAASVGNGAVARADNARSCSPHCPLLSYRIFDYGDSCWSRPRNTDPRFRLTRFLPWQEHCGKCDTPGLHRKPLLLPHCKHLNIDQTGSLLALRLSLDSDALRTNLPSGNNVAHQHHKLHRSEAFLRAVHEPPFPVADAAAHILTLELGSSTYHR